MNDGNRTGRVWLVGAGPGDPGLLTIKGKEVLAHAEVVVYDALVGRGILQMIPVDAERIYVGKRSGRHSMRQEEINRLLVEKALAGRRVVRLKGGDPFLFGRGGEELEALIENGIPYEVVPGISSAIAVPAYQGIPVTHRDFASSVHIVTGHPRADVSDTMADNTFVGKKADCHHQGSRVDYDALVRVGGTLVFLMGVASLGEICRGLLKAGMDSEMPAALLMQGTMARQERIVATVATLEQAVAAEGAKTPAVIVVGRVCALADQFSWVNALPLGRVRVFLTRPKELVEKSAGQLCALGAEVMECPAIRTVKRKHNVMFWEAFGHINDYQWLVFTSPTGVRIFFEELAAQKKDVRVLAGVKIACIGSGSAEELAKHGLYTDLLPEVFDGAHLGAALFQASSFGDRILIPRAAAGNSELLDALTGRIVDDIPMYDTIFETNLFADWQEELLFGENDYVFFTSASTVHGFATALGKKYDGGDDSEKLSMSDLAVADKTMNTIKPKMPIREFPKIKAICIGAQTAQAAKSYGMQTWTAGQATIESMIECLMNVIHDIT